MTVEEPDLDSSAPSVSEPTRRRIALRRIGAVFAGVAGIGAVLGGFTGYWSAYRTITTEFLAPALPKPTGSRLSIAIMPFANLSGDTAEDYFADGMVDNLTTDLSTQIAGLMVAG